MKKQRILSLIMTGLLLLPTVAYAKGNDSEHGKSANVTTTEVKANNSENKVNASNKEQKQNEKNSTGENKKAENQANKEAKKAEIQAFKQSMKEKHDAMNTLRTEIKAVREQIEPKKIELTSILGDLQSGAKTLPEDQLNQLISLSSTIKTDGDNLKATHSIEIEKIIERIKARDFSNALSALDNVIAKLQTRLDTLNKLNTDLDSMLAIARQAAVPVTDTVSTTTSNTTQDTTANK